MCFVMHPTHAVSTPIGVQALVMVKVHHSAHVVRIDLKSEDYYTTLYADNPIDTWIELIKWFLGGYANIL